ncbi:hypothetical protein BC936DRAFT_149282 [Jimgerdemannia flammicorona]|uniref:Protein argonaute N-terminal domain-containing protein n=1 Tax=Jimgerdemannia flammicorona TaxID=994334 RepID=A0A433D157_9FUNG|nr:hypothetical protein BC936DRAFT_149282 [Jimgerdemannia flammicorona]
MSTNITFTLPKRPAVGVRGRVVVVRTNYYEIDQVPKGPHYHYDCKITDKVPTVPNPGKAGKAAKPIPKAKVSRIVQQYVERVLQSKIRVVYDGKNNVYSHAKLPQDKLVTEVTLESPGGSSDVYKIVLELVNTNPMDALNNYLRGVPPADRDQVAQFASSVNYLNVLLRHWPAQQYIASGKNIYRSQGATRMSSGLDVWQGVFQSARLGGVGMDGRPTGE